MKKITFFIFLLASFGYFSQAPSVILCLGDDATVCQGQTVQINNCGGAGSPSSGIYLNNPTTLPQMSDDEYSAAIPVGFSFNFYGSNHTQCVIGSNGIISFDLSNVDAYCPYSLTGGGTLPSGNLTGTRNSIMACYMDMNPSQDNALGEFGSIQYQTIGTAPNRKFVVLYQNINGFNCGEECNYIAVIMHETTNIVDVMIGRKMSCPGWNGDLAIQGVNSPSGAVATITPGRNNTVWSAVQDGKRFLPTSPSNTSNYTVSNTPYEIVVGQNSNSSWSNTLGQTFPYNNGTLNVTTVPPGTTGYFLTTTACGIGVGSVGDTTWITRNNVSATATSTPDFCNSSVGSVTANPGAGIAPFTFNWPTLGSTNQTVSNVPAGTYSVQVTDNLGCTATANVTVINNNATYSASSTLVSCPGGNDGTATVVMTPPLGSITYQWNDPLSQTTQTAIGLAAGNYSCIITSSVGCTGNVSIMVNEIPGMLTGFTTITNATCNSLNDGILTVSVSQGTPPYIYSWDNSMSTTNTANDLLAGIHTVTVTDSKGCIVNDTETIGEPPALHIDVITPTSQICPEDDILLSVIGSGGSTPHTYTWTENGTFIGNGTSMTVDPDFTATQYCVTLSEACGSPVHDTCTMVNFPVAIIPSIEPDKDVACEPGYFEFSNTSSNSNEIATTYFEFSDGSSYLENGFDSTSNMFIIAGDYHVLMTITSIYGCVYSDTIKNIIKVNPSPTSDFTFSANPATIFETVIQVHDKSSIDVVSWQWVSSFSTPTTSNSEDPTFTFPEQEGSYPVSLIVTTEQGCIDTTTYVMHIIQDILFFAPNTFTPDGDEHNQTWGFYVQGIDIYNFDLYIFNRWGQTVWESHDPSVKWDGTYNGKIIQAGTYTWIARVKSPINDDLKEFTGAINILK